MCGRGVLLIGGSVGPLRRGRGRLHSNFFFHPKGFRGNDFATIKISTKSFRPF